MPYRTDIKRAKVHVCGHSGCDKAFGSSSDRNRHQLTHGDRREFVCSYCGKGFVQRTALDAHENSHTGRRPYPCPVDNCSRTFSDRSSRSRHVKEIHQARFYPCTAVVGCNYLNKRRSGLMSHIQSKHHCSLQTAQDLASTVPPVSDMVHEFATPLAKKEESDDEAEEDGDLGADMSAGPSRRSSRIARMSITNVPSLNVRPRRRAALAARRHLMESDTSAPSTPPLHLEDSQYQIFETPQLQPMGLPRIGRPSEDFFNSVINHDMLAPGRFASGSGSGTATPFSQHNLSGYSTPVVPHQTDLLEINGQRIEVSSHQMMQFTMHVNNTGGIQLPQYFAAPVPTGARSAQLAAYGWPQQMQWAAALGFQHQIPEPMPLSESYLKFSQPSYNGTPIHSTPMTPMPGNA